MKILYNLKNSLVKPKIETETNVVPLDENSLKMFILDESSRIRFVLRPLISEFFKENDIHTDFGNVDSEEKFKRFIRDIAIDIDLFVLTTRPSHSLLESEWERRFDILKEHPRVKNILVLCDEEYLEDVFMKIQGDTNSFLFLRENNISKLTRERLDPCLNQIKRAICPD